MVTIYETLKSKKPILIDVDKALARIKTGRSKVAVEGVRNGGVDKKDLPCVIFAGEITEPTRKDVDVKTHSGYMVLDWDKVDPISKKSQLSQDPYIYAAWISPSGNGVKALVRIPAKIETHSEYYDSFIGRYPELDTTSRNIARLCFESFDPNLFLNKNSTTWTSRFSKVRDKQNNNNIRKTHRNNKILSIAVGMVRGSVDGEKHDTLLRAAKLLGGYIAVGRIEEAHAVQVLTDEILAKNIKDPQGALQAIKDGIEYGKSRPIQEAKKIEKAQEFIKRDDGTFDFLADQQEIDEYERAVIDGTLEMGLSTGLTGLDEYWLIKRNHLVFFLGLDGSGKSTVCWYLAVLAAINHGWKFAVYSAENSDGHVSRKFKEFYIGKTLEQMNDAEKKEADEFVRKYFRILTSKKNYTWEELLLRGEILFDEDFEYDCLIVDPYNSLDIPHGTDNHRHNQNSLNLIRVFKENYSAVWIPDHANTFAARDKDSDGYIRRPYKSSVDGGQLKANKADDFLAVHRNSKHPTEWMYTEIHSDKIKVQETGGKPSPNDDPFIMSMRKDRCGYIQVDSRDSVAEHRNRLPYKEIDDSEQEDEWEYKPDDFE